jgi:LPS O-antigen subunit length determinant protein (WzzB/FepE family)
MQNNSNGSDSQLAISLLQSNVFLSTFIESRDILPELVAAKSWNPKTKVLSYDKNKYNSKKRIWENKAKNNLPSNQQAYNLLLGRISIVEDTKTSYITLGIDHLSPEVARQWVQWLIEDVNTTIANKQINQARTSISYLETQIKLTPYAELRSMFYEIIQQQTQKMMLANVRDEFALTTIDPAIAPEHKSRPSKSIILIVGTLFGLIFSTLGALINFFYRKKEGDDLNINY